MYNSNLVMMKILLYLTLIAVEVKVVFLNGVGAFWPWFCYCCISIRTSCTYIYSLAKFAEDDQVIKLCPVRLM